MWKNRLEESLVINLFTPKPKYENELEFSEHLSNYLRNKKIKRFKRNTTKEGGEEGPLRINTEHQKTRKNGKPDITVRQRGGRILLNWRKLSNPFFIEAKIGRKFSKNKKTGWIKEIEKGLNQFLRYKYKKKSEKKKSLEKYGDYHILVTCPRFFTSAFNSRDFKGKEISDAILVRFLWQLGIGVLYLTNNARNPTILGTFNEQEGFYVEDQND